MNNIEEKVKPYGNCLPKCYAYVHVDIPNHKGYTKIGQTERDDVDERIREQNQTAAIKIKYEKNGLKMLYMKMAKHLAIMIFIDI